MTSVEWEMHPNENIASMHLDRDVPPIGEIEHPDGVVEVAKNSRYELFIKKGRMFDWDEIKPKMEAEVDRILGDANEVINENRN